MGTTILSYTSVFLFFCFLFGCLFIVVVVLFETRSYYIDKTSLELAMQPWLASNSPPPTSASQVLGLQPGTTVPICTFCFPLVNFQGAFSFLCCQHKCVSLALSESVRKPPGWRNIRSQGEAIALGLVFCPLGAACRTGVSVDLLVCQGGFPWSWHLTK